MISLVFLGGLQRREKRGSAFPFLAEVPDEALEFNRAVQSHSQRPESYRAILDGEIVALDGIGRPAFYDLMKRHCQPVYYAFDILWLNGRDCPLRS